MDRYLLPFEILPAMNEQTPINQCPVSTASSQNQASCPVHEVPGNFDPFDQPFQTMPAATVAEANPDQVDSTGGNTRSNANFVYIRNNAMRVKVGDNDGKAVDRTFSFIVIGI